MQHAWSYEQCARHNSHHHIQQQCTQQQHKQEDGRMAFDTCPHSSRCQEKPATLRIHQSQHTSHVISRLAIRPHSTSTTRCVQVGAAGGTGEEALVRLARFKLQQLLLPSHWQCSPLATAFDLPPRCPQTLEAELPGQ